MSTPSASSPTRRTALKLFSMPLLPLGAGALLGACAAPANQAGVSTRFIGMNAPGLDNPANMAKTYVASALEVMRADGSRQSYQLGYESFFITGDRVSDGAGGTVLAGGFYDILNRPIMDKSVPGKERHFFSDCPDGTTLTQVPNASVKGVKGKPVFAVVQFEYANMNQAGADMYGRLPSPIAVLTLDQDPHTGKLSLVKYHNVDTSEVNGLWITCGASLSPWGTHLSSEEYEPDAHFVADNKEFKAFSKNLFGEETIANPYHYGHLPEVTVNPNGTGSIKKHYCMGRLSHELVQVMPDNRTALMGNDATNSGLFMFVADKEKDLSAGSLYAAKLSPGLSINPADAGAKLSWIKLGSAKSSEIEAMANKLKPADIMSVMKTDPQDASYTKIFYGGAANWVKLMPGMEKAAAFLESQRYAALLGASMGFSKMEGTTVNIKDKVAYSAIQNVQDSMVVGGKGYSAAHNIGMSKPLVAGMVLAHQLSGGQTDTQGAAIKSEWVAVQTRTLLAGEDIAPDALGNKSNPDKVGNPDNLKFSETMRTLFIGEDSSTHVNNMLWAYNVDTHQLSRLATMPVGAEATGLHVEDNLNGWTYIMNNFQHPGDWSALHSKVKGATEAAINANYKDRFGAAVGYLTATPSAIKLSV